MPLSSGDRLGHYEILSALGVGGMGEVYRARDTTLNRDVAIKVLLPAVASDADRLARFSREAQVLASLNHPNIAAIYGLERGSDNPALVMELVEGPTLADRLATGAIPLDEVLSIARQIAEALETAHEQVIIHRDLKPTNVKVRDDGTVKVLDFGLAKAYAANPESSADQSQSPTLAQTGTQLGVLIGTAAYMSPEQARGKPVDKRADIWAFGVVVFEMLSGERLFSGETVSDTLAAVLRSEPDWNALPSATPVRLRRFLRRCLEKDPRQRIRDMGDVRLELQSIVDSPQELPEAVTSHGGGRLSALTLGGAMVLAAVALGGFFAGRRSHIPDRRVARFEITLPEEYSLSDGTQGALAIATDDRAITFAASDGTTTRLYVKWLDRTEPQPIPGTEGARDPFFSPDGRWVGFFANGHLEKVSLADGTLVKLTQANDSTGASWAPDGTIVFAPDYKSGLVRVSSDGGETRPLTVRDTAAGEASHGWPDVLPDGEHVLYTIEHKGRPFEEAAIAVVSLSTGESKVVLRGGTAARYSPSGHLVYGRGSRLLAVAFDLEHLEVSGEVMTVADGVSAEVGRGRTHFAISRAGSLTFVPGDLNEYKRELAWASRDGELTPATREQRAYQYFSLAPDGERLLAQILGSDDDLWLLDLSRDDLTRLTFGAENILPEWAADGTRFVWTSDRDGVANLYLGSLDGASSFERLAPDEREQWFAGWSPDGSHIVYTVEDPMTQGDIFLLPMDGERRPRALVRTEFDERLPSLSPDGRWLAYFSDETGQWEIYVQGFPEAGNKRRVSDSRGADPFIPGLSNSFRPARWSRDGREVFYWNDDDLLSAPVTPGSGFDSGPPRVLFTTTGVRAFDTAPDGQRFLLDHQVSATPLTRIVVALGGATEIGKRASPR